MKVLELDGKPYRVIDGTPNNLFRPLSKEEESEFLAWARIHRYDEVRCIYHPVIQNTMLLAQEERGSRKTVVLESDPGFKRRS